MLLPYSLVFSLFQIATSKSREVLCQNENPKTPVHCFCNSQTYNNALKAECFVFTNLANDSTIWSLFATQSNLRNLTISQRSDKKLCFVPTEALTQLQSLEILEIKYASITSIHPYAFANLTNLHTITISRNQIETLQPYAFAHLPNLLRLSLEKNRLRELKRSIFVELDRLESLSLSENNINLIEDGVFEDLSELKIMRLGQNAIVGLDRKMFVGLSSLEKLDLSDNRIGEIGDLVFAELWSLEVLILENNDIQSISERAFDGLNNLVYLSLKKNYLKSLPEGVFESVFKLTFLDLRQNQLQTLTIDNISPIWDVLLNATSFLHIEQNNFICDCRLQWMHQLRNETRNPQVRYALDEVTCQTNDTRENSLQPQQNPAAYQNEFNEQDLEEYDDDDSDSVILPHNSENFLDLPLDSLPCPILHTISEDLYNATEKREIQTTSSGSRKPSGISIKFLIIFVLFFNKN